MNLEEAQSELNILKHRYQLGEINLDRLIDLSFQIGTKVKPKEGKKSRKDGITN